MVRYSLITLLSIGCLFTTDILAEGSDFTEADSEEAASKASNAKVASIPVNYDYISLAIGGGKLNSDLLEGRDGVTVSDINARWLIQDWWISNLQYKARFTHFGDENDRADYITFSVARRFAIMQKGDFYTGAKLGGVKVKLRDQNGSTVESEKGFLLGAFAGVNYRLTDAIQGNMVLEYLDYDITHEASFEISADYYFTEHFSLGAYGRTIWNNHSTLDQGGAVVKYAF
ncbi:MULTISPECIES: hypothetical protein [unclassified Vibrio]|uniref:hypothetical protein n=1 Tax=unclassified Vibrio TaxID=2614977 RepID=UPI0009ED6E97|nr:MULTISPECIES: hypothetical protein [unclassified Vibrio]